MTRLEATTTTDAGPEQPMTRLEATTTIGAGPEPRP
jgi:hypothetical protein